MDLFVVVLLNRDLNLLMGMVCLLFEVDLLHGIRLVFLRLLRLLILVLVLLNLGFRLILIQEVIDEW